MNRTGLLIALVVVSAFQTVRANELEDLQAKKKLEDARTEAYTAEAKRVKAESDLKEGGRRCIRCATCKRGGLDDTRNKY